MISFTALWKKNKVSSPSFEKTIRYLIHKELGRIEASFSSKLVSTINPSLPIWDSIVLNNLGKKPPAYYKKNRMEEIISLYDDAIKDEYEKILEGERGKKIIELFDKEFPNSGITDIKKVDFVFWQIRD